MGEGGILYLIAQGSSQNAIWTAFHLRVNAFVEEARSELCIPTAVLDGPESFCSLLLA